MFSSYKKVLQNRRVVLKELTIQQWQSSSNSYLSVRQVAKVAKCSTDVLADINIQQGKDKEDGAPILLHYKVDYIV